MKASFKERDLLMFSINPLFASVYNLNSSYPTRLPSYFQFPFSDNNYSVRVHTIALVELGSIVANLGDSSQGHDCHL